MEQVIKWGFLHFLDPDFKDFPVLTEYGLAVGERLEGGTSMFHPCNEDGSKFIGPYSDYAGFLVQPRLYCKFVPPEIVIKDRKDT